MVAAVNDIPVAAVESAHRSENEILPEHEARWPATEQAKTLILERYDGTSSTNHAIGQKLLSDGGPYPSWRIQQIAAQLGLAEGKRDEIIARIRAQEDGASAARQARQGATPVVESAEQALATVTQRQKAEPTAARELLREDLQAIVTEDPRCEQCHQPFEPWKTGRGLNRRTCRNCFSQRMQTIRNDRSKSTPTETPAREPGWVDVLPAPAFITPAEGPAQPAIIDCPLDGPDDDDVELTFGDLPGSGAIFTLLDLLPTDGRWQWGRRRKWLAAFTATLDLLIDEERIEGQEAD